MKKAGPYRARRGAGTSIFGPYFSKPHVFSPPTAQFQPREHHAVIRLATAISVHKFSSKKALCSLSSSKIIVFWHKSLFSTVYRGATAAGTVPRVPGRSTCIGHTRDELRSPSDGRVMIIWMPPLGPGSRHGAPKRPCSRPASARGKPWNAEGPELLWGRTAGANLGMRKAQDAVRGTTASPRFLVICRYIF